jgi:hypothetical protein
MIPLKFIIIYDNELSIVIINFENEWDERVRLLLKGELAKRGITHRKLVDLLKEVGVDTTKASIDNKLSRGTFSATFLCQCLNAIGCTYLKLDLN